MAFTTDSGVKGALVVLHLASGKARRVLDGHPSIKRTRGAVKADGEVLRRPDGARREFAADGIALSGDGESRWSPASRVRREIAAPKWLKILLHPELLGAGLGQLHRRLIGAAGNLELCEWDLVCPIA